jgi:hypothetical protein
VPSTLSTAPLPSSTQRPVATTATMTAPTTANTIAHGSIARGSIARENNQIKRRCLVSTAVLGQHGGRLASSVALGQHGGVWSARRCLVSAAYHRHDRFMRQRQALKWDTAVVCLSSLGLSRLQARNKFFQAATSACVTHFVTLAPPRARGVHVGARTRAREEGRVRAPPRLTGHGTLCDSPCSLRFRDQLNPLFFR